VAGRAVEVAGSNVDDGRGAEIADTGLIGTLVLPDDERRLYE